MKKIIRQICGVFVIGSIALVLGFCISVTVYHFFKINGPGTIFVILFFSAAIYWLVTDDNPSSGSSGPGGNSRHHHYSNFD